uniref:Uncharacterized protein n=1 Tax=Myotis myotis TaxID=51298 RepID=A0A7J7Z520_MYOMY|nr:hypothetical protein mMyoMyo1_010413 [Myotis myotis]
MQEQGPLADLTPSPQKSTIQPTAYPLPESRNYGEEIPLTTGNNNNRHFPPLTIQPHSLSPSSSAFPFPLPLLLSLPLFLPFSSLLLSPSLSLSLSCTPTHTHAPFTLLPQCWINQVHDELGTWLSLREENL